MGVRRKRELIPLEKSKRVIKITPRQRKRRLVHYILGGFCIALAILCLMYCMSIAAIQSGSSFFVIWGLFAVLFAGFAFLLLMPHILKRIPRWIRIIALTLVAIGAVFVIGMSTLISSAITYEAQPGADYLIVLGAQWKANGPSAVLRYRLDAALAYLEENPEAQVIVTGAQGPNEHISEAEGMAGYLENAGIAPERIHREDRATNTFENVKYSSAFCNPQSDKVIVVTNDFHVYRSVKLAESQGYEDVSGLAGLSNTWLLPHNVLRECLAIVKEILVGNI